MRQKFLLSASPGSRAGGSKAMGEPWPWLWNVWGVTSPSWQLLTAHVLLLARHFLLLRLRWVTNMEIIAQGIDFYLCSLWKSSVTWDLSVCECASVFLRPLTWVMGMEERWPKDLAHCCEMGISSWGAGGSVVHLTRGHFCLGFCTSRCLAPYVSGGCHEYCCLVPSFRKTQGKELGGAAVARAG